MKLYILNGNTDNIHDIPEYIINDPTKFALLYSIVAEPDRISGITFHEILPIRFWPNPEHSFSYYKAILINPTEEILTLISLLGIEYSYPNTDITPNIYTLLGGPKNAT